MLTPVEASILITGLAVAAKAMLVLPVAIAIAFALSRPNLPGRVALDGLAHLPMILPPVLVGFMLLMVFGRQGLTGGVFHLAFTQNGAALATAVMIFPLLVRSIRLSFEATDPRLFEAAAMLGASPIDRFFTIALPLALPGVIAGTVTAFAAAMGEFGAVITFAANIPGQTQTLPLAIFTVLQQPGGDVEAMRLAALSFAVAFSGLVAAELFQRWTRKRLLG
jgi:molybdate transport system permease protein